MMNFYSFQPVWILIMTVACAGTTASNAVAQTTSGSSVEFRIDTDVYFDTSRPPFFSTQTLFFQDRIMDWDDARRRLMRIDLREKQIDLADFAAQRRCRIDFEALASGLEKLKSQLTPEEQQAWTATKEPVEENGSFLLESGNGRYRFKTIAPFAPEAASAYAEFANVSVLVSAIYPPNNPPLQRLQLNEFLSRESLLPVEIQLTDPNSKSKNSITARILVQNSLTNQDRERAKDWDVLVQTLKLVSDADYFQAERIARKRAGTTK